MYDRNSDLWRAAARLKRGYESELNPETMYDPGMIEAAETLTSNHDEIMEALDALETLRRTRQRHASPLGRALQWMLGIRPNVA